MEDDISVKISLKGREMGGKWKHREHFSLQNKQKVNAM